MQWHSSGQAMLNQGQTCFNMHCTKPAPGLCSGCLDEAQNKCMTLRSVTVQSHPSGQTSGPLASPRASQLLQGGAGASSQDTPRTDGAAESLGPAVRVLLPGKQSLTRGELAAATNALQVQTAAASYFLHPCLLWQLAQLWRPPAGGRPAVDVPPLEHAPCCQKMPLQASLLRGVWAADCAGRC